MTRPLRASLAPIVALVATVTACSGGGSPGAPSAPAPVPSATRSASGAPSASVQIVLRIPSPNASASASVRRRAYVSAATQSFTVTASGAGATASALVNVSSSSCTSGSSGIVCSIAIAAPIGSDTFVVTTYAASGGTGAVLSTGTAVQTISGTAANVVPLVLDGVVATIGFAIANAYLPVVDGGSTAATVIGKDASGETIIGTYATAITLTPAAGLTPSATTIANSAAAVISIAYNGVSRTALAISAASGSASGTGSIVPTTHFHIYTTAALITGGANPFPIVLGPDGALYFGDLGPYVVYPSFLFYGPTSPGVLFRLDPTSGSFTSVQLAGIGPSGLHFVGNDLYVTEEVSGKVGRILGAGSGGFTVANYSELTLPDSNPSEIGSEPIAFPRRMADLGGTLYVTSALDASIEEVPLANWATGTSAVTRIQGNSTDRPDGITAGSDGNIYAVGYTSNFAGNNLLELVPGATTITHVADTVTAPDPGTQLRFIAQGTNGPFYLTASLDAPDADPIESYAGGTFTALAQPSPLQYQQPDDIVRGSGTLLDFVDFYNNSIGTYDTSAGVFREYPVPVPQASLSPQVSDIADGLDQSFWVTMQNHLGGLSPQEEVGRLVLAQGWQVLPEGPLAISALGPSGAIPIAIAQSTAGADTVGVTTSTPSICSVTAPTSYVDTYVVTGLAAGACIVAAVDETGRTVTESIPVSTASLTINVRSRRSIHEALP